MNRLALSLIFIFSIASEAAAGAKTNINEVTDLFEQNIVGKKELFEQLEMDKANGISRLESGEGPSAIEGSSDSELEISKLGGIKAIDLDGMGREKRNSAEYKFYDENELEPNWSKSGNKMHKQDANRIAEATAKTLGDLMIKLKDLGLVDCKTAKGPTVKEPVYHIDLRKEELTNTEYDQFFCEELRNRYNCRDEVSLKCIKKELRIEKKSWNFDGPSILHNDGWLGKEWSSGWMARPFYITPYNEAAIRQSIAIWTGFKVENIKDLQVNPRGNERIVYMIPPDVVFHTYTVHFKHVDPNPIACLEWAEEWVERCSLQ